MVAIITTDPPDKVIFTYPDVKLRRQLPVTVIWDTGNPAVKGRILRSLNGGEEKPLAGAPQQVRGRAPDKISLGQVLTFILQNAANGQEIGRAKVTTEMDALAAHLTDPDRDFINKVSVDPGPDTISLAFRTKKPAVPFVEIRRHGTGELADAWTGTAGFQQQHQRVFNGFGAGLPQDTTFDMRIVAEKDIGGGRVRASVRARIIRRSGAR